MARVVLWSDDERPRPELRYSPGWACDACGTAHHEPIPALFNTQSPIGRCGRCDGYGRTIGIDMHRVVPDPRVALEDGAVACFQSPAYEEWQQRLMDGCFRAAVPIDVPWMDLRAEHRRWVAEGGAHWAGVRGFFKQLEQDRYKAHVRIFIARYRGYTHCEVCGGTGLSDDARSVRLGAEHLGDVLHMRIDQALAWVESVDLDAELAGALDPLLNEIRGRLSYLVECGGHYLELNRAARTLSGGEMHRVLLATSVGRMLTDTCYVLDEPTAGLHAHDTARLLRVIERLRDLGNTVIVVEHDADVIESADHIVELGPRGGERGGRVTFRRCDRRAARERHGDRRHAPQAQEAWTKACERTARVPDDS